MASPIRRATLLLFCALLLNGCDSHPGVKTRYRLERKLWAARAEGVPVLKDFANATPDDVEAALAAYSAILDANPFMSGEWQSWDAATIADVRAILAESRIALATVYFRLHEQRLAMTTFTQATTGSGLLPRTTPYDVYLERVHSLYERSPVDSLWFDCSNRFEMAIADPGFWQQPPPVSPAFLGIPLHLVRTMPGHLQGEDRDAFIDQVDGMYERFGRTWPYTGIGAGARLYRAQLAVVEGDLERALILTRAGLDRAEDPHDILQLRLLRADVLVSGLERYDEAYLEYERLLKLPDLGGDVHTVQLERARLDLVTGNTTRAVETLVQLERNKRVPGPIRARAMLMYAKHLERTQQWKEAGVVLRRVQTNFPRTDAAVLAPIVAIRHHVDRGDALAANRSLERATDFYLTRIERGISHERLVEQDMLIECYLLTGAPQSVADLLPRESRTWEETSRFGAHYKSAMIYAYLLDDPAGGARILKKGIELFPETRYSGIAQDQLNRLRHASNQ